MSRSYRKNQFIENLYIRTIRSYQTQKSESGTFDELQEYGFEPSNRHRARANYLPTSLEDIFLSWHPRKYKRYKKAAKFHHRGN